MRASRGCARVDERFVRVRSLRREGCHQVADAEQAESREPLAPTQTRRRCTVVIEVRMNWTQWMDERARSLDRRLARDDVS
jgi:hypothetical protein